MLPKTDPPNPPVLMLVDKCLHDQYKYLLSNWFRGMTLLICWLVWMLRWLSTTNPGVAMQLTEILPEGSVFKACEEAPTLDSMVLVSTTYICPCMSGIFKKGTSSP